MSVVWQLLLTVVVCSLLSRVILTCSLVCWPVRKRALAAGNPTRRGSKLTSAASERQQLERLKQQQQLVKLKVEITFQVSQQSICSERVDICMARRDQVSDTSRQVPRKRKNDSYQREKYRSESRGADRQCTWTHVPWFHKRTRSILVCFTQVASKDYPGVYPGEDHTWNVTKFRDGLKLEVQRLTPSSVEFDLIGVDASVANSLRRTLIAEVPTIAIESVYVYNNTSIMQDEVLASRLGLIPLKVDPRKMNWKPQASGGDGWTGLEESKYIVSETIGF